MKRFLKAEWTGLEPATPCVTGMYSNQLNYHSVYIKNEFFCECKFTILFYICKHNFENYALDFGFPDAMRFRHILMPSTAKEKKRAT
jgi:hypothetical protein